jgi:hypothetical protein
MAIRACIGAIAVLAVGCQRASDAPLSADEAKAVQVAKDWVKREFGGDPDAATFDVSPNHRDAGWWIHIDWNSDIPGDHCSLLLDADFAVVKVFPGA